MLFGVYYSIRVTYPTLRDIHINKKLHIIILIVLIVVISSNFGYSATANTITFGQPFPLVEVKSGNNSSIKTVNAANIIADITNQLESSVLTTTYPISNPCTVITSDKKLHVTTSEHNEYQFALIANEETGDSTFCISKFGQQVFHVDGYHFAPLLDEFSMIDANNYRYLETASDFMEFAFKDVTNNDIPELVFKSYSGGMHCCTTVYIVELGKSLTVLADLYLGNANASLKDIDDDGLMDISTREDIFAYWYASYALSPIPEIVFSFDKQDNRYRVNTSLMRKPPPSIEEVQEKAIGWSSNGWEGEPDNCISVSEHTLCRLPWEYAITLLYTGNADAAKQYVNLAWKDNSAFSSQDDFWVKVYEQIDKSDFSKEIFKIRPGI